MEAQNLSGDGHQKTVGELNCSSDLTPGLHGQLTFISIYFNTFMSVNAFLGNALILIALQKESSLHPSSKLLLRSFATTDLCVGLISEPLTVTSWMSVAIGHPNMCRYASGAVFLTANIFCGASVLTLAAVSVDRLLALLLGLRYKQVVTLKRTYVMVITLWVLPALLTAMWFGTPL